MPSNVLEITIDPDIVLDEERTKGMPDDLKGHLLAMITQAAKKHGCHWTELTWGAKIVDGNPIIKVKRKP